MSEWQEFLCGAFAYGVTITGCIAMFGLLLWAFALAIVSVCKWLRVWHVICLAVSVRLHGKNFHDNQFWWAIQERASRSRWAAKNIADFAMKHAPDESENTP